jgi:hypothetical protein
MRTSYRKPFNLPLEKLGNSPIKKTYDFYKHIGNLWDSKYLSSPKIAKYYLEPQETYLAGPKSPKQLLAIESTERSRIHQEKATQSKLASRLRLFERKQQREEVFLR